MRTNQFRSLDRSRTFHARGYQQEKGAVLIFALIILLVMTVLAITSIGNSTLEAKMSGNFSQQLTAFQAAEQGLRVAESWMFENLDSLSPKRDEDADNWLNWFNAEDTSSGAGLYSTRDSHRANSKVCRGDDHCVFDPRDDAQWCSGGGCKLPKGFLTLGDTLRGDKLSTVGGNVSREPVFIIEYLGPAGLNSRSIVLGNRRMGAPLESFRITVIGWGQDETSRHVLQSHIVIPL